MNSEARKRLHGDTCTDHTCDAHAELRRLKAIEDGLKLLRQQWHGISLHGRWDEAKHYRWLVERLDSVLNVSDWTQP